MTDVHINIGDHGSGSFFIEENGEKIGTMEFHVSGATLTAMHTEVSNAWKGHGLGNKLLDAMVDYARKNNLKIVPKCPFVRAQFVRHPELYVDIWQKEE
jgi:predicted GNAT family acetyltransferase